MALGSITKRVDSRGRVHWRVRVNLRTPDGTRVTHQSRVATERLAQRLVRSLLAQHGSPVGTNSLGVPTN
jgi:hypothetical protein